MITCTVATVVLVALAAWGGQWFWRITSRDAADLQRRFRDRVEGVRADER